MPVCYAVRCITRVLLIQLMNRVWSVWKFGSFTNKAQIFLIFSMPSVTLSPVVLLSSWLLQMRNSRRSSMLCKVKECEYLPAKTCSSRLSGRVPLF